MNEPALCCSVVVLVGVSLQFNINPEQIYVELPPAKIGPMPSFCLSDETHACHYLVCMHAENSLPPRA